MNNQDQKNFNILIMCILLAYGGAISNMNVMNINGGKMPVLTDEWSYEDSTHFTFTPEERSQVNSWFYSDIFPIELPFDNKAYFSIGDAIMFIGILGMLWYVTFPLFQLIKSRMKK